MINLTFEQISERRSGDGFIHLDELFINSDSEREVRGNINRDKRWFKINDGKAMFKSNAEEALYAHYSELICTELARQAGVETAEYDIAKCNGKIGIITKNMCKPGEEMLTINELIGDGPTYEEYPDNTDIYFVFDALETKLMLDGYGQEVVDACMLQLRKQLLFDLYIMETDRHTENISFIVGKHAVTGKPHIRMAPMYDTESALLLYDDADHMKNVWTNRAVTHSITNLQEPKICVIPEGDGAPEQSGLDKGLFEFLRAQVGTAYDAPSEEMWKATLDFLVEDERAYEFSANVLNVLDINKAIENVERNKKCTIPEEVKQMARACFAVRQTEIAFELGLDFKEKNISGKELT